MTMDAILTSLSLGLLATTSPCILPLYPGFLAYLSGNQAVGSKGRYFLGVFVLLGVLTMMLALGGLIALLSISIGSALSIIIPVADALIIGLGVLLLANINPFKQLPQLQMPGLSHPFANAYVYGLLYGPIALPCSGPLVVGVFAFSLTAGEVFGKLAIFFWFGLGFGIPLLALSLLSGTLQRQITRLFAVHARKVNIIGGLILVAVGAYDLWSNWELILAYLR
jgi:cytochrome c-type biogenesis protein